MNHIQSISSTGVIVGFGMVTIPLSVTATIACSKIILINIIADIAIRILTFNAYSASVSGVSFVNVPFLWEGSFILATIGGYLTTLSLTVLVASKIYQRCVTS